MTTIPSEKLIHNLCVGCNAVGIINKSDCSYSLIYAEDEMHDLFSNNYQNEETRTEVIRSIIDEKYQDALIKFLSKENIQSIKGKKRNEIIIRHKNGSWERVVLQSFDDEDYLVIKLIDCTDSKRDILLKDTLFADSFDATYTLALIIDLDADIISRVSVKDQEVTTFLYSEKWSKVYNETIRRIHPDDLPDFMSKTHPAFLNSCPIGTRINVSYRIKNENNIDYRYLNTQFFIHESTHYHRTMTCLIIDITKNVIERQELIRLSERDELTYLYNRAKLERMIEEEYNKTQYCGLLFFDINNLKSINDSFGHRAGDECVCRAAEAIRSITNRNIHAYRFGGDEFVAVAQNVQYEDLDHLIYLVNHRLEDLNVGKKFKCEMAIGKSWTMEEVDIKYLMTIADMDMYRNKKIMKNG